MAACYAVENSLVDSTTGNNYQADPTPSARGLRNLVLGIEFIMSHLTHFYVLAALDYVQGPAGAPGDPNPPQWGALPSQSGPWSPDFDDSYYLDVPGGLPGLGLPAVYTALTRNDVSGLWWDVIRDYTIALQLQRRATDLMGALGGRWPMFSNLVCGGVTHPNLSSADLTAIYNLAVEYLFQGKAGASDLEGGLQAGAGTLIAPERGTILHFIQHHYIPTVQVVAAVYSNYDNTNGGAKGLQTSGGSWDGALHGGLGYGAGAGNFLSWGVFHDNAAELAGDLTQHPGHLLSSGVYLSGAGGLQPGSELGIAPVSPITLAQACAKEFIANSKYDDGTPTYAAGLAPDQGYTKPNKANGYSWIKSPRIIGDGTMVAAGTHVCEVGPLARMVCSNLYDVTGATKYPMYAVDTNRPILKAVRDVLDTALGGALGGQTGGLSTMDRHRARALETEQVALALPGWLGLLGGPTVNKNWAPPQSGNASGWGTNEAPRGALLHYIDYTDNRIEKYQCIVPTTWNASPRHGSSSGTAGPIEASIMNPAILHSCKSSASGRAGGANQYVPVEILRVTHSFDPCIACAVHKVEGKKVKAKRLNTKKEVRRR